MTAQEKIQRGYMVSTRTAGNSDYRVSFVPRGLQQARTSGRVKKAPEHIAIVKIADESVAWDTQPADAEAAVQDFDADAVRRAKAVHGWVTMVTDLVNTVEGWAKELGWASKRIEKPMEDSEIGKYVSLALLLQAETTKVLLEPISRSAPGAEGVVDLYLMPGYDDIASLYFYNNRWNLHYMSAEQKAGASIREAESKPLTKAAFKKVLEEMKANAQ